MIDCCSQGRVRTKSGSSHNCQSTPVVILWNGASYELWEDQIFLSVSGSRPLPGEPGSQSCVFYSYPQHLSFLCTWGKRWRAPLVVMLGVRMADDIIYRGLSPVGNLTNHKPAWGRYHHLSHMINALTSPVGREPMTYMSHPATYYSWTRTRVKFVASTRWLPDCWRSQLSTRIVVY